MLGGAMRGFNLLLVLAGLMVGALMMQWRLSRRTLESIDADRFLPNEIFAGQKSHLRYRLKNRSGWLSAWMLRVEDTLESISDGTSASLSVGAPILEPGSEVSLSADAQFKRRGRYRVTKLRVITHFPFSLSTSTITKHKETAIVVYPSILPLVRSWRNKIMNAGSGRSANHNQRGPVQGDFYGLREWKNGDSVRWIHWRTSARVGEPTVRQFEQEKSLSLCVAVDACLRQPSDDESTELAISFGASLCCTDDLIPTDQSTLLCVGSKAQLVSGQINARPAIRNMLEALADIEAVSTPDWEAALAQLNLQRIPMKQMLVVSVRSFQEFQAEHPTEASKLREWSRRGRFSWVNVKTDLQDWIDTPRDKLQSIDSLESPKQSEQASMHTDATNSPTGQTQPEEVVHGS